MSYGLGIVGCGLIGEKRARAIGAGRLIACADVDEGRARAVASRSGAKIFTDWRVLLTQPDVDVVLVATQHHNLAEITLAAIESGKHVFVEKPAARKASELEPLMHAAKQQGVKVHVGFSHRYHRAFRKARELFENGALGELMFIRARYGHGGRIGYESEWRADPGLSGGGELIDQGIHLVDLSRWFLGEFQDIQGFAHTYYWNMPVEDNGFLLLKNAKKQVAFLHASCTEWKNLFSMEIYGHKAKLEITGLGGSYGTERLTYYRMLPEMGPPETTTWEYPMSDDSWGVELSEFYEDIRLNREPSVGLRDAYEALKIIENIYLNSNNDNRT
jgi:predicted dehydrogenase